MSISATDYYFRLLQYAWKYWHILLIGTVSLITLSLCNTGFLVAIKFVTDHGFAQHREYSRFFLPLLLFGLLTLRGVSGFVASFSMRWVARRVIADLRCQVFSHLMTLPISFFDAHSVGELSTKLTYNAEQTAQATTTVAISLVRDTLTIIGMIGYMLYLDWRLTFIFVLIGPGMMTYLKIMTPRLRSAGKIVQDTVGGMSKILEEALSGQRIVKIFGGETYESARFNEVATENQRVQIRLARISVLNSMVIELLAAGCFAIVLFYAIGNSTAGEFTAFVGGLLMLIAPIKNLTNVNEHLQIGVSAAQSIFALMDEAPEQNQGKVLLPQSKGEISFQNVSLQYNNTKRKALKNISFQVRAGEKLALVGHSGGGKSSIVNLLPRFYEYQSGKILLDNVDICDISLEQLRKQYSYVSQDVLLFNDSVYKNIAYGSLHAVNRDQVISACISASAWEFIEQLPEGLDSQIGDRGVRLSGGQKQRLAIARAILKNAPILLLDEGTSALDTKSELQVQKALDTLTQNRTSIVIAHRLSTIENADRILVIHQGELVEMGTHTELIEKKGYYWKLYQRQIAQKNH